MGRERATRKRKGLRGLLRGLLGVLLSAALTPAAAQLVTYEDWSTESIDAERWRTASGASTPYEVARLVSNGQLLHLLRVYGETEDDLETQTATDELRFAQGRFTAVQWETVVEGYVLQGCATPGSLPSEVRVSMRALFFNDGSSQGAGDQTGNVTARLRLVRASDSLAPPELVQAHGLVTRCTAPDCSTFEVLGDLALGEVLLGQLNTFQIIWDELRSQIEFQKNADPPMPVAYGVPVATRLLTRTWGVTGRAGNCTASPRPVASVHATLDNIIVFFP
jgi:hypothetical protein